MGDTTRATAPVDEIEPVELRSAPLAALLTWFIPGLGQAYQRRYGKAALFFVCIMGIFLIGCYLGSDRDFGVARVVYYSMRPDDKRYYFFPQACVGIGVVPAVLQAARVSEGSPPMLGGFMAPPYLPRPGAAAPLRPGNHGPTLDQIVAKIPDHFEMGTIYTVVAGLLNLLAIFDALEGPVFIGRRRERPAEDDADSEDKGPVRGDEPRLQRKPS